MKSDTRGWHRASSFVVNHARDCGRPTYVRSLVLWHPGLDSFVNTTIGGWLFWAFPMLLSGRSLLCVTCDTMEFQSKVAHFIFNFIEDRREGEEPHVFFFFDDDLDLLPTKLRDTLTER